MSTHELGATVLHLSPEDRAVAMPGGAWFWHQMMSGQFEDERVAGVATGGWLVTRFTHSGDWPHWDMHPEGDEVLTALSGSCTFHLEREEGIEQIVLSAGHTLIVPRGVWHRATGDEPTEIFALTAGKRTQHRPA